METELLKNAVREVFLEFQSPRSEITVREYVRDVYLPYYCSKERNRLRNELKGFDVIMSYNNFSGKKIVDVNIPPIPAMCLLRHSYV